MQRTMLAAIHATEERLTAPQYMACCSLRQNFSGNTVVFNVHKWHHSETHSCYAEL